MNPVPQTTSPEELKDWITSGSDVVVLDVRSAAEFESLHILGSYNVPLPLLAEHTEELASKLDTKVVLVCQSGVRATEAKTNLASSRIRQRPCLGRRRPRLQAGRRPDR